MSKRLPFPRRLSVLVAILLIGLPLAVWLDLRTISEAALTRQSAEINTVITAIRGFYSSDVVGRVLDGHGIPTTVTNDYAVHPGAIPIPATFSLELGRVVSEHQAGIGYRFVSDYPFRHRASHALDPFERNALHSLRKDASLRLTDVSWHGFDTTVRLIAPVIMGQTCVNCHNTHPDSPKRDWKIGNVRGIQEILITQPLATDISDFKFLLIYFLFAAVLGVGFLLLQRRQAALIQGVNAELAGKNRFLSDISTKISRYLSPQVYTSIFSGRTDVVIHTERKKLTIFFSDIKNFTSTTERLQPEELTALLNEYFTEMSAIALKWGGTIDKFIGDAILVFFGDPETKGTAEDAKACVRMAVEMQNRLAELNIAWRNRGIEEPFRARMGVNTGYCNVGNFGSVDRMDYTIIGAEANLSARLESIAEPDTVVISYETYALVRDIVTAHALAPIQMKGISREVIPYTIDGLRDAGGTIDQPIRAHQPGLEMYLDLAKVDAEHAEGVKATLREALAALERAARKRDST